MIPDYQVLRTYIDSHPELGATADEIAEAMNTERKVGVRLRDLTMAEVANALNSKFANLIDAARTGNKGAQALIELLRDGALATQAAAVISAVNALVADGTITAADRAALAALATDDVMRSPAEEVYGPVVILPRHVEEALAL